MSESMLQLVVLAKLLAMTSPQTRTEHHLDGDRTSKKNGQ